MEMNKYKLYEGLKIGEYKLLYKADRLTGKSKSRRHWMCKCKCGVIKEVQAGHLRNKVCTKCKECAKIDTMASAYNKYWSSIKQGAKKRKHIISITKEFAFKVLEKQKYKCVLTGLPIEIAFGRKAHNRGEVKNTASLDRIDSDKGYTEDNIQWIHQDVNYMKSWFSEDRFKEICRLVTEKSSLAYFKED